MNMPSDSQSCVLCGQPRPLSPVCQAKDWEFGVPGTWTLARCPDCGLYQQDPLPSENDIGTFYPATYSPYDDKSPIRYLFQFVYGQDAKQIRKLIGPTGRILDV